MAEQDYIINKSVAIPEAGCWIWMGAVTPAGYGFSNSPKRKKNNELAHRASYRIFNGEIPDGMIVAHSCDNPYCVNPSHLWLATHKQNSSDMVIKKRSARGEKCGKSKLSEEQIKFIRESDFSHRKLGAMFNVSHANIGYIKRGATWNV